MDAKTITTHLLTVDHEELYDEDARWDVDDLKRFCVDALAKIGEIKRNNGGRK